MFTISYSVIAAGYKLPDRRDRARYIALDHSSDTWEFPLFFYKNNFCQYCFNTRFHGETLQTSENIFRGKVNISF